ncbi:MAG TPA: hypothetical protein VN627_11245 [Novosphingobium sp.]|nr:hypothetical protein [Novosphingobium sp.]
MTTHAGADQPVTGPSSASARSKTRALESLADMSAGRGYGSPAKIKDLGRNCLCCFGMEVDDCDRSSLGGAKRDCLAYPARHLSQR